MIIQAPYSCDPLLSKGRTHFEEENPQEIFLKDKEKVIHSSAFRRLEYKTQVFVNHVGDHYRNRLTHSLEVAHVAKTIARKLRINEDLTETVALSHDLGHPPFGHAGEESLNRVTKGFGGFDHNVQTIKILVTLEQRYPNFNGLNLSFEALEGIAKHNGPIIPKSNKSHLDLLSLFDGTLFNPQTQPSLEAQVASLADDIAYINHDLDDGLRAGMFNIDELLSLPVIGDILTSIKKSNIPDPLIKYDLIRQLSALMINDLVAQTLANIDSNGIKDYSDVIVQTQATATFSRDVENAKNIIKDFLMQRVYRNFRVNRMSEKSQDLIEKIFNRYLASPNCLPTEWYTKIEDLSNMNLVAGYITDYIAGMTDRYAIEEYKRLFDPNFF